MKGLLLIGMLIIIGLLWTISVRAVRIHKRMKSIEKNIVLEVANTKKTFQDLVGELFGEDDSDAKRKDARVIDAEEDDG